jgi:hypothetical protein
MDKVINDGVFTKIVGTRITKSSYDLFIEQQKLFSPTDDELTEFTGKYSKLIDANKELFQLLSSVEELVMQLRSLDKLNHNIKYSVGGRNSEYIYARAPFYRHGHNKKTITDIVSKVEVHGNEMVEFPNILQSRAQTYLAMKMRAVIDTNIENVDNLYTKMFGELK